MKHMSWGCQKQMIPGRHSKEQKSGQGPGPTADMPSQTDSPASPWHSWWIVTQNSPSKKPKETSPLGFGFANTITVNWLIISVCSAWISGNADFGTNFHSDVQMKAMHSWLCIPYGAIGIVKLFENRASQYRKYIYPSFLCWYQYVRCCNVQYYTVQDASVFYRVPVMKD